MKKWLASISMVALGVFALSTTVFASESKKAEDSYLYFIDGVQVEAKEFPHYDQVFAETNEQNKTLEVSEDNYDYYIETSNGIEKVSKEVYDSVNGVDSEKTTRSTGTWSITNSAIASGSTKYYYQGNGNDFSVASDEYIHLTINVASHARSFNVGYVGTSELKEKIDLPKDKGAKIAFKDRIKVPGTYRVLIENLGNSTETINGEIAVKTR